MHSQDAAQSPNPFSLQRGEGTVTGKRPTGSCTKNNMSAGYGQDSPFIPHEGGGYQGHSTLVENHQYDMGPERTTERTSEGLPILPCESYGRACRGIMDSPHYDGYPRHTGRPSQDHAPPPMGNGSLGSQMLPAMSTPCFNESVDISGQHLMVQQVGEITWHTLKCVVR